MREDIIDCYQRVIITLSNGTVGVFTGPVICGEDAKLSVVKIEFVEPQLLPKGCSWQSLKGAKEETV